MSALAWSPISETTGAGHSPFADAAPKLFTRLAVMPVGGSDWKKPLLKGWNKWTRRPGKDFIEKLMERCPGANIGTVCGPSGLFIVDNDDPRAVQAMLERFGDTPLKTSTPSGGVHLWYRNSGEGCANLRREGLKVDLKGIGGFVVIPPSIRPTGRYAGNTYDFLEGSWEDLGHLPTIRAGALPSGSKSASRAAPLRAVKEGYRNDHLLLWLMRHAPHCDDRDALLEVARTINANSFDPPLSEEEIEKTVASVWRYQSTNSNWLGKEQRVYTLRSEWEAFAAHPNGSYGYLLFSKLRMAHWGHNEFPVSAKAMAQAGTIPGWGVRRYRAALAAIIAVGLLREVHHGGKRRGDPNLFSLSTVIGKGAFRAPNIINNTPLPPLPPPRGEEEAGYGDVSRRRAG